MTEEFKFPDELENTADIVLDSKDMKILVDERVKAYLDTLPWLKVDFSESKSGSGFVIQGHHGC